MKVSRFIGVAPGLFFAVLLALTLLAPGITARAQSPEPLNPLEQTLRTAAFEGRIGMVRSSLDQGVAPDAADADGDTALDFAQKNGHQGAVGVLKKEMK